MFRAFLSLVPYRRQAPLGARRARVGAVYERPGKLAIAAALCVAQAACARGENAEEREIARLREALTRVQAHHDGIDQRVAQLEVKSSDVHADRVTPPEATKRAPTPTPDLRVVRIAPEDTGPESEVEPEGPRPVVRVIGGGTGGARRAARGQTDVVETSDPQPPPPVDGAADSISLGPSPGARPSALDPMARRAYDDALAMVYAKKYDAALDAFAGFLVKWPDHPNADNAHYWRGECYFAKGDFAQAEDQFRGVALRFPMGNKVPDALLKLAITQDKLGKSAEATTTREKLRREYPRSEAARKSAATGSKKETP